MKTPLVATMFLVAACAGCTSTRPTAPAAPATPTRNVAEAQARQEKAVAFIKAGKLAEAETELKAALEADLFCGPAHNNLGLVYYKQKRYYEAAWEFQAAAKLMPHKTEPLNNLGLVFEASGRMGEASDCYEKALAIEPDDVEATGNMARVCARTGRQDDRMRQLLNDIVGRDPRPEWVGWARERLMSMHEPLPQGISVPAREAPLPPPGARPLDE